jgi:hypothetical protein
MSVDFVLLAGRTSSDEVAGEGGQPWPPIVTFYKGLSAKAASMARGGGFVESSEDRVANGGRNI